MKFLFSKKDKNNYEEIEKYLIMIRGTDKFFRDGGGGKWVTLSYKPTTYSDHSKIGNTIKCYDLNKDNDISIEMNPSSKLFTNAKNIVFMLRKPIVLFHQDRNSDNCSEGNREVVYIADSESQIKRVGLNYYSNDLYFMIFKLKKGGKRFFISDNEKRIYKPLLHGIPDEKGWRECNGRTEFYKFLLKEHLLSKYIYCSLYYLYWKKYIDTRNIVILSKFYNLFSKLL